VQDDQMANHLNRFLLLLGVSKKSHGCVENIINWPNFFFFNIFSRDIKWTFFDLKWVPIKMNEIDVAQQNTIRSFEIILTLTEIQTSRIDFGCKKAYITVKGKCFTFRYNKFVQLYAIFGFHMILTQHWSARSYSLCTKVLNRNGKWINIVWMNTSKSYLEWGFEFWCFNIFLFVKLIIEDNSWPQFLVSLFQDIHQSINTRIFLLKRVIND